MSRAAGPSAGAGAGGDVDPVRAAAAVRELLLALGHDPESEALRRTPERVARFAAEHWRATAQAPAIPPEAVIPAPGPGPVVLEGIPLRSTCEHHLLPFSGSVAIVLAPGRWIVGLGHLTRLVEQVGARLQLQERVAEQIAQAVQTALDPVGVLVVVRAAHSCLWSRGDGDARTALAVVAAHGRYLDEGLRAEALALATRLQHDGV